MVRFAHRLWSSPTLTTWGSLMLRTGGVLVTTPLLLNRFSTAEIAVWYFFATVTSLQIVFEMGFTPSFSRAVAYALGGAEHVGAAGTSRIRPVVTSGTLLDRVCFTMQAVYVRLAVALLVLFGAVGTMTAIHPISLLPSPGEGWAAWAIVLTAAVLGLNNLTYTVYLQGTDRIALLRRVEIVASLGSIASSLFVLLAGGTIVTLAFATVVWPLAGSEWNRRICIRERPAFATRLGHLDREVLHDVWPAAWRSGVGILMSAGVIQLSALLLAQRGSAAELASFLISLRMLQLLVTASQAPFYSKLPRLARMHAEGNGAEQLALATRGMALSYWAYAAGVVVIGTTAPLLLELVGSNAVFIPRSLWFLMGLAFFVERYGAMHIQIYSVTNDIIWHKANGLAGAVFLVVLWLGFERLGLYAFPAGILAGYLGFYAWYAAAHSYRVLKTAFWSFELRTSAYPAFVLVFTAMSEHFL